MRRVRSLPQVTQLFKGRAKIQIQVCPTEAVRVTNVSLIEPLGQSPTLVPVHLYLTTHCFFFFFKALSKCFLTDFCQVNHTFSLQTFTF